MDATSRATGFEGGWPILLTEPSADDMEMIGRLHQLCDWVITVDRNAGIEYFDSPHEAEAIFDAYVIDAVPERDDLGCLQLITSTAHFDEVRRLLDDTLALMGLSGSARNCTFLLGQLKALSGRLAMRLAASAGGSVASSVGAELVALALARKKCLDSDVSDPCWPSLRRGFFIPLDDVRDLLPELPEPEDLLPTDAARADLLHVSIPQKGRLSLRFIEVKYRRHLSLARSSGLAETISRQTAVTRGRWLRWFFGAEITPAERTLRAASLARVLRFYAAKACRHHLAVDLYSRFTEELTRFLISPSDYELAGNDAPDRGLVFCPDFTEARAERLATSLDGDCEVWLFGPDTLPDLPPHLIEERPESPPVEATVDLMSPKDSPTAAESSLKSDENCAIALGTSKAGDTVTWTPSIRGNPHLMLVGLPGMGKTTSLINICRQLHEHGITPIVFSYHDDIDERLTIDFPEMARYDCRHLGFNPMRVVQPGPLAHVESAGQLRDIFQAIYPELGDLQLEQLRTAVKESYEAVGWGGEHAPESPPPFRHFVERIRQNGGGEKRSQTLLARLKELDDFQFFAAEQGEATLLETGQPRIIQIHSIGNEMVQRAYASFVLYRIYQDMFRRGRQDRITHAVIFR